jgi:selenocysteine lyase/cysteine desulfurase
MAQTAGMDDARKQFEIEPGYFNTASLGVPPRPVLEAVLAGVDAWRRGRDSLADYDEAVARSRAAFGRLVNVDPEQVAIGATVSSLVGLVATGVPDGAEVLVADGDFTSVLYPFAVQAVRGVTLRSVPLAELVGAITDRTALVAVSLVQSADGAVLDLGALTAAARAHGALTMVDGTQACGWLPVDAADVDYFVAATYKWLLAPRGAAMLAVHSGRLDALVPHAAGWYAGADVWGDTIYGLPARLASTARRLDTSPAVLAWAGTAPALEFLEQVGVAAIRDHDVALANRLRAGLGLPPGESAIVSVPLPLDARERLAAADIRTAVRAGQVRFACHLYTTESDVDAALAAAHPA